jgi:hypothetical protein
VNNTGVFMDIISLLTMAFCIGLIICIIYFIVSWVCLPFDFLSAYKERSELEESKKGREFVQWLDENKYAKAIFDSYANEELNSTGNDILMTMHEKGLVKLGTKVDKSTSSDETNTNLNEKAETNKLITIAFVSGFLTLILLGSFVIWF